MTSTPDFSKTESFASWDQLMLHIQLDSGPIVVPAIRVCQKADPHVHQQPWGFGDRRSGHLRHHAVRLPPISTWCVGQAASMGSLLLAAGSPGMRHSLPNA